MESESKSSMKYMRREIGITFSMHAYHKGLSTLLCKIAPTFGFKPLWYFLTVTVPCSYNI